MPPKSSEAGSVPSPPPWVTLPVLTHPWSPSHEIGSLLAAPTQTEIVVSGADKQRVGEVAAKIRGYRPPEPYKGKGVKYAGETIIRKEAKKA